MSWKIADKDKIPKGLVDKLKEFRDKYVLPKYSTMHPEWNSQLDAFTWWNRKGKKL